MSCKLQSTQNAPTMKALVLKAARARFRRRKGILAIFEHGHWWVRLVFPRKHCDEGDGYLFDKTYDAVDAEGPGSIYGFNFEEV